MNNLYNDTKTKHYILYVFFASVLLTDFLLLMSNIKTNIKKVVLLINIVSLILVAKNRDLWLPFLGVSICPSNLLQVSTPNNNHSVVINTKPNTKILYWAAYENEGLVDYKQAYGDYKNSGVVYSDKNGKAVLKIMKGSGYKVPNKVLDKHVHYRTVEDNLLGEVQTINY